MRLRRRASLPGTRVHRARGVGLVVAAAVVGALAMVVLPAPAASAASAGWADLTFEGTANDWTGTMHQRAVGFPVAAVASDSGGGSALGRQSGRTTFLSASTPVGEVYGSSRGRPYLNLRPFTANGGGVPGSSTTTYSFDAPTPASGWTFVLGDVDADAVTVSATGPGGVPVPAADLGFRSAFNYCGAGVCTENDDVPRWDPSTATLTGNAAAEDTNGASAWFEPQVPLATLTFVFTRRAGFPVYQTWFASQSHELSGRVEAPGAVRRGLTVELFAPDGRVVGRTTTGADGSYRFPDLATYAGYRVALVRPPGYTSDDPLATTVDLSRRDQVADFSLRAVVPVAVSGTVTDPDGKPLPGRTVTLTGPGPDLSTVTAADGSYVFDEVPVGEGYTLKVVAPDGAVDPPARSISVLEGSEQPITGQDFTIAPAPVGTMSGTVRAEGGGEVSGVRIVVTDEDGVERVALTDDRGRWSLTDLPPGRYVAGVSPPAGTTVVGDATRPVRIPVQGGGVDGVDFELRVPAPPATFAAGGTVLDEAGMAFPGVLVTVLDPDGQPYAAATTDRDGTWRVPGLLPADGWSVTVDPPSGYSVQDDGTQTFDVTDADVTGLDFVLVEKTGSGAGNGNGSSGSGTGSTPKLASSGGPGLGPVLAGLLLTACGLALLRRRSRGSPAAVR